MMKKKWYSVENIFYVPNMKGKWYRHLNILAALFIGFGGIGMNVSHELPGVFYIVSLATGLIIFAIQLTMMQRDHKLENNS